MLVREPRMSSRFTVSADKRDSTLESVGKLVLTLWLPCRLSFDKSVSNTPLSPPSTTIVGRTAIQSRLSVFCLVQLFGWSFTADIDVRFGWLFRWQLTSVECWAVTGDSSGAGGVCPATKLFRLKSASCSANDRVQKECDGENCSDSAGIPVNRFRNDAIISIDDGCGISRRKPPTSSFSASGVDRPDMLLIGE